MLNELEKSWSVGGTNLFAMQMTWSFYARSKGSAERVMSTLVSFIENKLLLKVNREKSQAAAMRKVKFLGYSFYKSKGEGRLRIHPKSVSKMKAKIKELTSRSNGCGNARRKEALCQYSTGWVTTLSWQT
jgi:hypothetical protein